MADATIYVYSDRFNSLAVAPKAWLIYIETSLNMTLGSTLTVMEVDSNGNNTGRYMTGLCALDYCGAFYSTPPDEYLFLFEPKSDILTMYIPTIFKNTVPASHTGNTNETILYSKLIPAGSFATNDILRMFIMGSGNNTVNTKTLRIRFNTSNSLSGATLVATRTFTNAAVASIPMVRNMAFQNSLSSQLISVTGTNFDSDEATANASTNTSLTINFAIDQYVIISGQLNTGTDTVTVRTAYGLIYR